MLFWEAFFFLEDERVNCHITITLGAEAFRPLQQHGSTSNTKPFVLKLQKSAGRRPVQRHLTWWPKQSSCSLALVEPIAGAQKTKRSLCSSGIRSRQTMQARSLIRQPCCWRKIRLSQRDNDWGINFFFCPVNLDEGEVLLLYSFKGSLLNNRRKRSLKIK